MTNTTLIGAGIAFTLLAFAIVAVIWVVRLISRPTRRMHSPSPSVEPLDDTATADQIVPSPTP